VHVKIKFRTNCQLVVVDRFYFYSVTSNQGHSDGGYIGIYTPQISPRNFLWGKNDVRTAIQQFYTPKQISGYAPASNHTSGNA